MDMELRFWVPADAEALMHALTVSPDLSTQFGDTQLARVDDCRNFIDRQLGRTESDGVNWAISVDGQAVGNVGLSNRDRRHDTAWVYYWVAVSHRCRGLASRALTALASAAFDELGVFRLELGHRVNNPASCAVATVAGFRPEGIERAKLRYGDQRYDVETHARLASDAAPPPPAFPRPRLT